MPEEYIRGHLEKMRVTASLQDVLGDIKVRVDADSVALDRLQRATDIVPISNRNGSLS